MNALSIIDPKKWFPIIAGSWLLLMEGYRLRPDNGHQYFLLSQALPDRFPPLPWLSTPLHHWFLCPPFIDPLWFLATLQGLCCLLTGWAALRVAKALGTSTVAALAVTGLWLALGHCGHDSSMAFIKGYVTPATVAGTALTWATAFFLEGKTLSTLATLFLAAGSHLSFAPVALLMAAARLGLDARASLSLKFSLPAFTLMTFGICAIGIDSWEAYTLERSPFRSDPETIEALLGSRMGLKFLCELALLGLVAIRHPFKWAMLPALMFFLSLAGLCLPGAWAFLRATPMAELMTLGLVASLGTRPLQRIPAVGLVLVLAFWQSTSGRLQAFNGLALDASPPEASAPMMSFIKSQTPKDSTFVIPPHFSTFRAHASRKPYVDIAAIPWSQVERTFWMDRLRDVYGTGPMKPENLYATSWHEILHRAWNTGAEYLLWPTSLVPRESNQDAQLLQDKTWTLIDLSKVTP
ncbi:MAG: DUF6798 domain-containing protein [Planctomycetota bacterium]